MNIGVLIEMTENNNNWPREIFNRQTANQIYENCIALDVTIQNKKAHQVTLISLKA